MQPSELFVNMVLQSWEIQVNRATKLLGSLSDDQLLHEIAPGRNTGLYIFGHLIAVHDAMLPLLGLGERIHPELDEIFITNPDKTGPQKPTPQVIRQYWSEVNAHVSERLASLTPDSWFHRHNAMTDADLEKDPRRNKLNVLINRSSHIAYHLGQLVLLK